MVVSLKDELTGVCVRMLYTVFAEGGIITKSICYENQGSEDVFLTKAL